MSQLLRNPYDFVPFEGSPRRSFTPNGQHTFIEGLTGEIVCELRVLTPLFVGTGQRTEQGRQALFSPAVTHNEPYIPAKSLKGMIRSVVETASDSCMGAISDQYPRVRLLGTRRIPSGYAPCTSVKNLCLACAMFGMTEEEGGSEESKVALAGRVWLTDAQLSSGWTNEFQRVELPGRFNKKDRSIAPIGSPKPAHEAFYFSDNDQCLGRKFYYRTRLWSDTLHRYRTAYQQAFGQDYRTIILETIPAEVKFTFTAHFLNLSEIELDCLLYGLCLEDGMCHHMGYGKPFGLGSVSIEAKTVRALHSESGVRGIALYLHYDSTQSGPDGSRIWNTPDREGYEARVWDRGKTAEQARKKLADILKWPRDEVFFYPTYKWFQEQRRGEKVTLAEYQAGTRQKKAGPTPGDRQRGRVKFFKADAGWGFIERPGQKDLFVHINQVRGKQPLQPGQEVEFAVGPGRQGKGPEAKDVEPL